MKRLPNDYLAPAIIETNTMTSAYFSNIFIGISREKCLRLCQDKGYQVTPFAQWIGIQPLNILLTFRNQTCLSVSQINPSIRP